MWTFLERTFGGVTFGGANRVEGSGTNIISKQRSQQSDIVRTK
jgi:hypothetical protein